MEPKTPAPRDALADLPESLRAPLARYLGSRSEADLDTVIHAALEDIAERRMVAPLPAETRFAEDLGLDSLGITEFVFFFEDFLGLRISNEELASMQTLGGLKRYLNQKLAG